MPYFYLLFHSFIIDITATARGLFLLGVLRIPCKGEVSLLRLCRRGGCAFKGSSKLVAGFGRGPGSPWSWLLDITYGPHKELHQAKLLLSLCGEPLIQTDAGWEPLSVSNKELWMESCPAIYWVTEEACAV